MLPSRQNLGSNSPSRDVSDLNHRLQIFGKVFENRSVFTYFEEAGGTFILAKHRNLWPERDIAGPLCQSEGSSQGCEFAIYGRGRRPLFLSPVDIARNPIASNLGSRNCAEKPGQMAQRVLYPFQAT